MLMTRHIIITALVVLVLVSLGSGVVLGQSDGTATPTPTPMDGQANNSTTTQTQTATPAGGENGLTKSEVVSIVQKSPWSVSEERAQAVQDWMSNPDNLDSLNSVESEDAAAWVRKYQQGAPSIQKDDRTYIQKLAPGVRMFDYEFDERAGTLTVWIEADSSESYQIWDTSYWACAPKGISKIPDGSSKSGTLARGDNKLVIPVEECQGRLQAGLRVAGNEYPISSDDPNGGDSIIPGPFNPREVQIIGVTGVLVGVSMVVVSIIRMRRKERKTVDRL
jgi:hypothetical protein